MQESMHAQPTPEAQRIETLDVLRGFALLGILLLNIVGFGMHSATYSNPALALGSAAEIWTWASIEIFAEGAMRALFSILFGAGVVLFTTGAAAKAAGIHYRRNLWLLAFGLFDAYVLLWSGDILVNYALAGMVLYWVRNVRPGRLLICAGVLIVLMSLMYLGVGYGLGLSKEAAQQIADVQAGETVDPELVNMAAAWEDLSEDYQPSRAEMDEELTQRKASYVSAFRWNVDEATGMLLFVLPMFLFWDALTLMLIGMGLYKLGILQGSRSTQFYVWTAALGFSVGLLVNSYEVRKAITGEFELLSIFAQAQPTYHFGRLGMALGYMSVLVLLVRAGTWQSLRTRLADVGRMALTNYLAHSLICLFIFTGAGFALVGELNRAQLYWVVVGIWLFQLWFSSFWLARYRFGPLEWLWRGLTYGAWPAIRRAEPKGGEKT